MNIKFKRVKVSLCVTFFDPKCQIKRSGYTVNENLWLKFVFLHALL
jgi:hypothetical protein